VALTCDATNGGAHSFNQWFNTTCVHRPGQGTWGNAPFAPFVGPGTFSGVNTAARFDINGNQVIRLLGR
jgi:hypothetical protein